MKYKRIVFKVGTSSLTNEDGSLSRSKVKDITQQLAMLHEAGHELILVSSGAIAAGFGALGFKKRPTKIADKQASAAVGQGLLLEEYTTNLLLRQIVSAQILLTQDDFVDKRRYKNAHQALSVLLNRGAIPIINENDSVVIDEVKVGDNDTLSAQVAAMVQADLLVLLTDVDGLYTGNPNSDPRAKRLRESRPSIVRLLIWLVELVRQTELGYVNQNQGCNYRDGIRSSCLYLLILEIRFHD